MRLCKICNGKISWSIMINGERRKLGPRLKCLSCLPYKPSKRGVERGVKKCLNCSESFKTRQFINGKTRDLSPRSYCLSCSPFGLHNSRQLHKLKDGLKTCNSCFIKLPLSEFIRYRRISGQQSQRLNSKCKSCYALLTKNKKRSLKEECIRYKGGECVKCGYDSCAAALVFHHLDPDSKDFSISQTKNFEYAKNELDKCILLCANCHAEEHYTD